MPDIRVGIKKTILNDAFCEMMRNYPVIVYDGAQFCRDEVTICIEEQIQFFVNDQHVATMVATPDELAEFAVGFLIAEGFLKTIDDIRSLEIDDLRVNVRTAPGVVPLVFDREIRSSGGVGNAGNPDVYKTPLPDGGMVFSIETLFSAVDMLHDLSSTWKRTGGTHSALIVSYDGETVVYAEDMGRHTAIDKVIGKALMMGIQLSNCSLTCTGRLPEGMIMKAYRVGIPLIISNNAPFSSGIDLAARLNLTVAGFVRKPKAIIYTGSQRIRDAKCADPR
jgi:formate dehydrogenase family accessory protein FdhD